jgi:hypothetical protein
MPKDPYVRYDSRSAQTWPMLEVSLGVTVAECGNCSRSWGSQRVCEDYRTLTGRRWSTLWLDGHSLAAPWEKMITDGTALRSGEISSDAPAVRLRAADSGYGLSAPFRRGSPLAN